VGETVTGYEVELWLIRHKTAQIDLCRSLCLCARSLSLFVFWCCIYLLCISVYHRMCVPLEVGLGVDVVTGGGGRGRGTRLTRSRRRRLGAAAKVTDTQEGKVRIETTRSVLIQTINISIGTGNHEILI
jgi:hypothetical protein